MTSLPTDNIYKFYTIFGLLIMGFCSTTYLNQEVKINLKISEADTKIELLECKRDLGMQEITDLDLILNNKYGNVIDSLKKHSIDSSVKYSSYSTIFADFAALSDSFSADDKNIFKFFSESKKKLFQNELERIEINALNKDITKFLRSMRVNYVFCILGFILGLYLFFNGFYYWHKLYQEPQDSAIMTKLQNKITPPKNLISDGFLKSFKSSLPFIIIGCIISFIIIFLGIDLFSWLKSLF